MRHNLSRFRLWRNGVLTDGLFWALVAWIALFMVAVEALRFLGVTT